VDIDINEILNLLWPGLIDEPKVLDSFLYIFEEKSDITESKMEEILKTLEKEYSGSLYNIILDIYYIYYNNLYSFLYILSFYLYYILCLSI